MQFITSNQQRECHLILLLLLLIVGLAGQLTLAVPMIRGGGTGEKLVEKGKNVLSDFLAYTQSSPEPEEIVEVLPLLHLDSSPSLFGYDHVGPYHHYEGQQYGWKVNSQSGSASKSPHTLYSPRVSTNFSLHRSLSLFLLLACFLCSLVLTNLHRHLDHPQTRAIPRAKPNIGSTQPIHTRLNYHLVHQNSIQQVSRVPRRISRSGPPSLHAFPALPLHLLPRVRFLPPFHREDGLPFKKMPCRWL